MFTLFFSIVCAWFAYFLPCFATYKALAQRPASAEELERLAQYWTVIGAFVATEYVAEWLVSWIPFYWELKTIFLLFLSLPQTQGSTYIYNAYLQPFFARNEASIDSGIISMQSNVVAFAHSRIGQLWELVWSVINKTPANGQAPPPGAPGSTQPPSAAPGAGLSFDNFAGLLRTYGPSLVNSFNPAAAKSNLNATPTPPPLTPPVASSASASTTSFQNSFADRRVPHTPEVDVDIPTPSLPNPYTNNNPYSQGPAPPFPEPHHA